MIKKLSILGLLGVAILTGYLIYGNAKKEATKILGSDNPPKNSEIQTLNLGQIELPYNNQFITVMWYELVNPENLSLIPNFDTKLTASDAFEKYNCKFLVSAGFYSKDGKPIGLLISDGKTINSWQKNSLLNGVFSINDMATPRVTQTQPQDHLQAAVQAGPILKENGSFLKLSLKNDSLDRRVVVAVTGGNKAVFLVIYSKSSVYSGPLLADLPDILKNFEPKAGLIFADALNLDGGTASTFTTSGFNLPEATNVGSFFCEKP